jgi:hypothetical protein
MFDLLVYVAIAVVAIAGAAAWLCFPKREPQARDGQGVDTAAPAYTLSPGTKKIPRYIASRTLNVGRTSRPARGFRPDHLPASKRQARAAGRGE